MLCANADIPLSPSSPDLLFQKRSSAEGLFRAYPRCPRFLFHSCNSCDSWFLLWLRLRPRQASAFQIIELDCTLGLCCWPDRLIFLPPIFLSFPRFCRGGLPRWVFRGRSTKRANSSRNERALQRPETAPLTRGLTSPARLCHGGRPMDAPDGGDVRLRQRAQLALLALDLVSRHDPHRQVLLPDFVVIQKHILDHRFVGRAYR